MRATRLFIVSAVLLVIGIALLLSGKGNINVQFALPVTATAFDVSASIGGWKAFTSMLAILLGTVLMVIAFIAALVEEVRPAR